MQVVTFVSVNKAALPDIKMIKTSVQKEQNYFDILTLEKNKKQLTPLKYFKMLTRQPSTSSHTLSGVNDTSCIRETSCSTHETGKHSPISLTGADDARSEIL